MQVRRRPLFALAVALCLCPVAHAADGKYEVTKTLKVGGEGRWDYITVDPASKRIFIGRSTHTQILNADTGEVLGDLKNTDGVHGVAIAPDANRGFTSNGKSNTLTMFNLKTLEPLGTISTGQNPDAILYDPASKKVFAFDGKSNDAAGVDASATPGTAALKIPLAGKPEGCAADGQGKVFIAIEDKSSVQVIDSKSMKVTDTWKIEGGEEPSGLALDAEHHRLFLGCGGNNVMAILDTTTGKTLATLPIGKGVDACAFDPSTGEAFASCGDGTVTVARETSPGKFEVTQTIKTKQGARTCTIDPTTHTLYLPTAEFEAAAGQKRPAAKPGSFMILVVSKAK